MIWKTLVSLDQLNNRNPGTIHETLGIEFTEIGEDFLEATMPVDQRTRQPAGLLHGGASVVLAESLGSIASRLVVGMDSAVCVGIEINASHLKAMKAGTVTGRVSPVRIGKSIHVWDIKIRDQQLKDQARDQAFDDAPLVCMSRLTVMVKG